MRELTAPGSKVEPDLITHSTLRNGYCHVCGIYKALLVAEETKKRVCGEMSVLATQ